MVRACMPALLPLLLACAAEPSPAGSGPPDDSGLPDADGGADTTPHLMLVPPYVQRTGPDVVQIRWETATGEQSTVEYGLTEALGITVQGTVEETGDGLLHTVELSDLLPDTAWSYAVQTGGTRSAVQRFRTPPGPGASFRLLAMSDMQRDDARPEQWAEVIAQGVLPFAQEEYGAEPADAFGLVLLAGDLVDNGWLASDWRDDFFAGAAPLMGQVPLLPVPGNHEGNSPLYWRYFALPENGSPGFEEHWWWLDHGGARVIGLDSNGGYKDQLQLDWLAEVLEAACEDEDIDLVLAQLHHPYQSELWPSGEEEWTGSVVGLLEDFSARCGKPSLHLFGHTHGYSRGQSQDHRHLWVDVATAGGAIDRWGAEGQTDYPEFSVSQDEYGFVLIEVSDQDYTLRRISLGTPESPRDGEETDRITVPFAPVAPDRPSLVDEGDTVRGSAFSHPMGGLLGASHWQVSADCEAFTDPVLDQWQQHEDWFQGIDRQAGVDLLALDDAALPAGTWCARLRVRDRGLAWSEWSDGVVVVAPSGG